nr:hypothetical protein [Kiritimatiellia bacterium]
MTRTTTANTSRRPASAMIALGLTLTAANLMANRITGYSFEAYDSLIEARVSAISQKKNLFVLSGAPWCTYCNKTKTYIASLGADFNSKFVVYYADVSQNAEMSGRLPQYGTFDPRTIDTTYGWSASANSYLDSSGYSPGMIDRCIAEANKHSIGSITGLRLEGMEAVFPNSSAALVAKADFSDGKTMVFPASSITWSATGSASVGSDGVLSVGANASVGNAITVTAKFPKGIAVGTSDSAAKEMSVVSTDSVKSIDVDLSEVNLADSTDVRFKCIATFDNGKKGEIPASSWSVSFARTLPYPDGTPLSALQTPRPVIDATGNLVYSTDYYYDDTYNQQVQGPGYSIGNHVLNVTANWGSLSHTKELTVWGPSRAWISEMTLLTPAGALAPGEVIRLRCPKLSYTYGDKVIETDDSELFEFQALVNVDLGNSTVPATGDD